MVKTNSFLWKLHSLNEILFQLNWNNNCTLTTILFNFPFVFKVIFCLWTQMSLPDFFHQNMSISSCVSQGLKKKQTNTTTTCSWKDNIFSGFTHDNFFYFTHDNFFYKCVSCSISVRPLLGYQHPCFLIGLRSPHQARNKAGYSLSPITPKHSLGIANSVFLLYSI